MQLRKYCPYDVGDYYITENAGNPAEKWAGTSWERIQDCMLMAAGSTYAAGSSYGSATHSLTTDEIPSHKHSVGAHAHGLNSHTHSVGAHAHGLNSHVHTYAKPNTATGGTAITTAQLAVHSHGWRYKGDAAGGSPRPRGSGPGEPGVTVATDVNTDTGSGSAHTHTIGTTSTNTGAASGSTANSAAFNTGAASGSTADSAAFDSGATGAGKAFSILNPCLAVYMWKRVA